MPSCVNALLVLVIAVISAMILNFGDIELEASSCDRTQPDCPDRFFSITYFEARNKFRMKAKEAQAELTTYPVHTDPETGLEYTIDAAIVRGGLDGNLIVHMSGTHGAEGFAGSAIQLALLAEIAEGKKLARETMPTMVFVHALNPTGMATNRRFNHNNVDLNRNCFANDEAWKTPLSRDPNVAGYVDLADALNPKMVPTLPNIVRHALLTLYLLATKGFGSMKRAIVTGQYYDAKGIFYGGRETEINHKILREILKPFHTFSRVVVVDVHTGLGPTGVDTMMIGSQPFLDKAKEIFDADTLMDCAVCGKTSGTQAGYELLIGEVLVEDIFVGGTLLEVSQEFGTKNPTAVGLSCVYENAAYWAARNSPIHERTGRWLKGSFYVQTVSWKSSVVKRGLKGVHSVVDYLARTQPSK